MPANIDPLLNLDTLLDDSHQPPVARRGHVTSTCQWDEGRADVGHLEDEAQGSHFLSPFVYHPDTKDSGKEATAPGHGEQNDQMARAKTLDPGEEPLIDNLYWNLLGTNNKIKQNKCLRY